MKLRFIALAALLLSGFGLIHTAQAGAIIPAAKPVITVGCAGGSDPAPTVTAPCSSGTPGDGTAINSAITLAAGGKVFIEKGTYYIDTPILPTSNTLLECAGSGTILTTAASTGSPLVGINAIYVHNVSHVRVTNCTINGNSATYPVTSASPVQDNFGDDVLVSGSSYVEVDHMFLENAGYHGFFVNNAGNSDHIHIHDSFFLSNGWRCIHLHGDDTDTVSYAEVNNNFCTTDGFSAGNSGNTNAGIFAVFDNGHYIDVHDNVAVGENGICFQASGFSTPQTVAATRAVLAHNLAINCVSSGFQISAGITDVELADNQSFGAGLDGLEIDAPSSALNGHFLINGGSYSYSTQHGIAIVSAGTGFLSEVSVVGTEVIGNGADGIYATSTNLDHVNFDSNAISANAGFGVNINCPSLTCTHIGLKGGRIRFNTGGGAGFTTVTDSIVEGVDFDDNTTSSGSPSTANLTFVTSSSRDTIVGNVFDFSTRGSFTSGNNLNLNDTTLTVMSVMSNAFHVTNGNTCIVYAATGGSLIGNEGSCNGNGINLLSGATNVEVAHNSLGATNISSGAVNNLIEVPATGSTPSCNQAATNGDKVLLFNPASVQTPTTGFTITPACGITELILTPAGTLASGTVKMPAAPWVGETVTVRSSQTVTALTVSANTGQTVNGAPTTIAAGGSFRCEASTTTVWYCSAP